MKGYLNFPKALSFLEQYGKDNHKDESFDKFIEDIDKELLELFYHRGIRVELITAYDSHIGTVYSVQGINLNYCKITLGNHPDNYEEAQVNALNQGVSDIMNFIYLISDYDAVIQHIGTGGPNPELFNIQFSIK